MERLIAAGLVTWAAGAMAAGGSVTLPGPGIELAGRFYRPAGDGPFPAIVMLHGCSGLWRGNEPTPNYRFWAEHFQKRGYAALLLDSFGPRGEREVCTQKDRRISEARDRPRDAYAALGWLTGRKDIDAARVHLMGWSHGGSSTLNALQPEAPGRPPEGPAFHSAVAFYPGCAVLARKPYAPVAPVLILAGGADDWTPARYCQALAKAASGAPVEIEVYEGAHHGFDLPGGSIRQRPEVRNPSNPTGWGATVGPHPQARLRAIERATAFIEGR